jgi:hypothetical protein
VKIYGGFLTSHTQLSERNRNYLTILTGDVGFQEYKFDNSLHVVTPSSSTISPINCVLDGFRIEAGYNIEATSGNEVAGIKCTGGASPRIERCTFMNNDGQLGAAAYCAGTSTAPAFIRCVFRDNSAALGGIGGGLFSIISHWGPCPGYTGGETSMPNSISECMEQADNLYTTFSQDWYDLMRDCRDSLCKRQLIECDD